MNTILKSVTGLLAVIFLVLASCQGPAENSDRTILFNGKDFTGWEMFFPPEANVVAEEIWTVKDGIIDCRGDINGYIRTVDEYSNYHLHVEWRWPGEGGNAGVLLHTQGPHMVWPDCIEAQGQSGSAGDFWVLTDAAIQANGEWVENTPEIKWMGARSKVESSEKPLGEWNEYDIYCNGNSILLLVNGVEQNYGVNASQGSGSICLQSEGTPVQYRNVWLEPLTEETRLIGDDLSNWVDNGHDWLTCGNAYQDPDTSNRRERAAGNAILIKTEPGTGYIVNGPEGKTEHLISLDSFGDIELHAEFMVTENSNSGLYIMGRYEAQVLDSWGKENPTDGDVGAIYHRWDTTRTPHAYDGSAPFVNAAREPGKWQTYDIVFEAPRFNEQGEKIRNARFVKVFLNGTLVQENFECTGPTRSSLFEHDETDERPMGPLMIQGDHGPVAYRNIWIKSL